MTRSPLTIAVNATVGEALEALQALDVRHLPVVNGTELVGMLSDRDVRPALNNAFDALLQEDGAGGSQLDVSVASLMSASLTTISPEDEVADAIELMLEQRVGALPVVDEPTGALVGIVSYVDILRAALELF